MAEHNEDEVVGVHQYWVAAFIDLLGQRQAMREIDFIPDHANPEQMERFIAGVHKTYGAVRSIQEIFENWMKHGSKPSTRIIDLNEDQLAIWRTMQPPPHYYQRFSDGIVLYLPLAEFKLLSPIAGIFSMIAAGGSALLLSLAAEIPIRAGIDVGTGMAMNGNELYGPVIAKAYELESDVAQYPRVVLGDECIRYIEAVFNTPGDDPKTASDRHLAVMCRNMLTMDDDGYYIIDFLGTGFRQYIARTIDRQAIDVAHKFVASQLEACHQKRNTKLALRYSHLLSYFKARLPLWNEDVKPFNIGPITGHG